MDIHAHTHIIHSSEGMHVCAWTQREPVRVFFALFLLSQVCGFLFPDWRAVQLQDLPLTTCTKENAAKVPGTLLSGLGGSSLLEERAIVLEEGCVFL